LIYQVYPTADQSYDLSALKQAESLFRIRKLDEAINLLKNTIPKYAEQTDIEPVTKAYLLLSGILVKKFQYFADKECLPLANKYIRTVIDLCKSKGESALLAEAYLIQSKIRQHTKKDERESLRKAKKIIDQLGSEYLKVKWMSFSVECDIKDNDFKGALQVAQEAIGQIDKLSDELRADLEANLYASLVTIYIKQQDYIKSIEYTQLVMQYANAFGDVEKELMALNNMAIIHGLKGEYGEAMEYLFEALDKSKEINFRGQVAKSLINLGSIYAQLFNSPEAIQKYNTVLAEYQDVLELSTTVILYNNLGNIHFESNDLSLAKSYYQQGLDYAEQSNYTEMLGHLNAQLAKCAIKLERLTEAQTLCKIASTYFNENPNLSGYQIHLINLGQIDFKEEKIDSAKWFLSKGLELAKQREDRNMQIVCFAALSNVYKKEGNFRKAVAFQDQYLDHSRELQLKKQNLQFLDLEISQVIKDKQRRIEQLIKDNEYKALLLKQSERIAEQNQALKEANEELRQYAYVTSHDLKEPLRMISNFSKLLEKKYKSELGEDSEEYFHYIDEGVYRINTLLDDLLKYTTIGNANVELGQVHLKDVIDITLMHLKVKIDESNTNFQIGNMPIVYSNQSLLIQLIQNIISNAIKFRKSDVAPKIKISSEENEISYILTITDNGIGIPEDQLKRIFIIFQRLHPRGTYEGTGIGLAICKKIIKKLGGQIWVKSTVDVGTSFTFTIPKVTMEF